MCFKCSHVAGLGTDLGGTSILPGVVNQGGQPLLEHFPRFHVFWVRILAKHLREAYDMKQLERAQTNVESNTNFRDASEFMFGFKGSLISSAAADVCIFRGKCPVKHRAKGAQRICR